MTVAERWELAGGLLALFAVGALIAYMVWRRRASASISLLDPMLTLVPPNHGPTSFIRRIPLPVVMHSISKVAWGFVAPIHSVGLATAADVSAAFASPGTGWVADGFVLGGSTDCPGGSSLECSGQSSFAYIDTRRRPAKVVKPSFPVGYTQKKVPIGGLRASQDRFATLSCCAPSSHQMDLLAIDVRPRASLGGAAASDDYYVFALGPDILSLAGISGPIRLSPKQAQATPGANVWIHDAAKHYMRFGLHPSAGAWAYFPESGRTVYLLFSDTHYPPLPVSL